MARRNPSSSWVRPVALLAGVGAAWYLLRGNAEATVPVPPAVTVPPTRPAPPVSLVERLAASAQARRVFWLQSAAYSLGLTDAYPDGVQGAGTNALIARINAAMGVRTPVGVFDDAALRRAIDGLAVLSADRTTPPRLIPNWLPRATVLAVNGTALAASHAAMLLQVQAL